MEAAGAAAPARWSVTVSWGRYGACVRRVVSPRCRRRSRAARGCAATRGSSRTSSGCARRYAIRVTACYSIHSAAGEHPLGAAIDAVPEPPHTWQATTGAVARLAGWKPSCAASGVAPACARPPFRFVAYNGYPGHGDPAHCQACGGGAHLHLSWLTSASAGQPENKPRSTYFAPTWIDTFTPHEGDAP